MRVVCHIEARGYKQERVRRIVEYILCQVLSRQGFNTEVMYGRFIARFSLHGLAVHESPGGVGVVVYREFFLHAILFHDEGGLELWLLGPFRNLHSLFDVHSHVVWTEVEEWQVVETPRAGGENKDGRVVGDYPLVGSRHETE